MAAKHERGPYLSSFVDAISKKLSSILEGDSILKDDYSARKSLQKSDDYLCDVEPVLDDAELKQFDNDRVKKWLVDLQDALYMADDLLDELATKAATATPRDQGNSSSWSHYVDSCIEDSGVNVIESTLESLVERKDKLGLNKSAKLDTSWRLPSTSLDSPDIFGSSDITINTYKSFGEACKRAVHLRTALDFTWYEYLESIDVKSIPWLLQQQLRVLSFRIKSLPESIGELIYLRYLNLSEARIVTLPESICKLYNLQTLILRDCYELEMLPSCMQDLVNLQHLDIRGVPRLKEMPKKMSKLKHLNFLSYYIIGEHEENGIRELGTLDNLDGSFDILNLENVKNSGEALEAKMGNKRHINTLKLYWFTGGYMDVETERHILEELQPHENLKELSIEGYRGETFPDWLGLSRYSSMTKLSLQRCKNCCKLPSLGQLPSLQHLEFSELDGLEKIDLAFYNNSGSFEQETPFKCLETLKIEKMAHWREWHFPDEFDGFPELRILSIRNCPVLSGDLPAHLPALEELHIFKCSELVCSLPRAPKIQQLCFGKSRPKRMLEISETQLAQPVLEWVPHLQSLRVEALQILNCHSLISISAYYLPASLTKIHVQGCGSLSSFQLGPLPNLEKLIINECPSMKCVEVPQALPGLRHLCILHCPRLVSLPALGLAAPHLVYLRINDCPEIDCFADECLPASLKTLQVKGCEKLARWITSKGLHSQVRL
ncbi:hypothetical protein Ahy_B09g095053 isoform C [Arachis hypogaea]|uniref:Uncharacterized protein n=1 Tax=Arachis hypogaea TaxID=3818 RepID=A0A444XCZ3_ARAHY|nr:hypothetical protein Ahy_B09g095053 isoform C [Arachis hypogaea]